MMMHRQTWFAVLAMTAFFLALNIHSWDPGVGGRRPPEPKGTQFERYFGWPACYRAEWWDSDDPALMLRIMQSAPFYYPSREMTLHARYVGSVAIAVDVLFALLAVIGIGLVAEGAARERRDRRTRATLIVVLLSLVGLYAVADSVAVHL